MPFAAGSAIAVLAGYCGGGDRVYRRVGRMYLSARIEQDSCHDPGHHDIPGGWSRLDGAGTCRPPVRAQ